MISTQNFVSSKFINIFQRSVAVINLPISCVLHSSKSSGPAAWCILSLKTPLLLRDSFVVFTIAMAFNLVISPALKRERRQTKKIFFFSLKEGAFSVYDPYSYDSCLSRSEEDLKNQA